MLNTVSQTKLFLQKGFVIHMYLHYTVHPLVIDFSSNSIFKCSGDHLHLSLQADPHSNQPAHPLSGCGRSPGWTDFDTINDRSNNVIMPGF